MTTRSTNRLVPSLALIVAGGALSLMAITTRPADTQAQNLQPSSRSEAPRSLMVNQRPVLGELVGDNERTIILGGEGVFYLDQGPTGEFYESMTDHDSMFAKPVKLMLVDLPDPW